MLVKYIGVKNNRVKKVIASRKTKKGKNDETIKKGGSKPPKSSDTIKGNNPKYWYLFQTVYDDAEIKKIADEMIDFFEANPDAYHITSFAAQKKIRRQTLYDFEKKSEYFAFCFKIVKDKIIDRIMKHGFSKGSNAAFPIFTLCNISEGEFQNRQNVNHSGSIGMDKINLNSLTDDQLHKLRAMLLKDIPIKDALLHIGVILD